MNVSVGDNQSPNATDETATTDEDTPVTVSVLDGDIDPDGDPLVVVDVGDPLNGSVVINNDGTVTYTPDPNFSGTEDFTYTVCDDGPACTIASVTVTVAPIDDAPIAVDDAVSATPGQTLTIDVLANDLEVDGEDLTITQIVQGGGQGTATIENGTVSYVTNGDGAGVDTVVYEVCDPQNNCAQATIRVTIGDDDNVVPDANDDEAETPPGASVLIDVIANDTDEDPSALRIVELQQPARGDARIEDGQVRYTPDPGFTGDDTFEYEVCDAQGACDRATVTGHRRRPQRRSGCARRHRGHQHGDAGHRAATVKRHRSRPQRC